MHRFCRYSEHERFANRDDDPIAQLRENYWTAKQVGKSGALLSSTVILRYYARAFLARRRMSIWSHRIQSSTRNWQCSTRSRTHARRCCAVLSTIRILYAVDYLFVFSVYSTRYCRAVTRRERARSLSKALGQGGQDAGGQNDGGCWTRGDVHRTTKVRSDKRKKKINQISDCRCVCLLCACTQSSKCSPTGQWSIVRRRCVRVSVPDTNTVALCFG